MSSNKKSAPKKVKASSSTRAPITHPSWIDMIKECITAHPDDARIGVSRPQIKKFVETTYKLEIGNAQNTQLAKAIASGEEKNIFSLPKGPSGRVKLAPKPKSDASKENKPAAKPKPAAVKTKALTKVPAKAPAKKTTTARSTVKKTPAAGSKKAVAAKKPAAKKAPAKKPAAAKKTATKSTKSSVTATKAKTATSKPKPKAAAKKAPSKARSKA